MKTITLTEREIDAIWSLLKPYSEGITKLKNRKGMDGCFKTWKDRYITPAECDALMKKLKKEGN